MGREVEGEVEVERGRWKERGEGRGVAGETVDERRKGREGN